MCGFYLNELLLRLLPREDAHEQLFDYYKYTLNNLAGKNLKNANESLATYLRRFELYMLQEIGYAVPLKMDGNDMPIDGDKAYRYEAEYGACTLSTTKNGVQLNGQSLLDMANDDYSNVQTKQQSKQGANRPSNKKNKRVYGWFQ